MTIQVPTRFQDEELVVLDQLVRAGIAKSRSEVIRIAVGQLAERTMRQRVGAAIAAGYTAKPQTDEEDAWARAAAHALTEAEPW